MIRDDSIKFMLTRQLGSHIPKNKKQLSDKERDILGFILDNLDKPMTAREIMKLNEENFDLSITLSNLVGMDLCDENSPDNSDHNMYSGKKSMESTYGLKVGTPRYHRAMYAFFRTEGTLWAILNGKMNYDKKLWPFRQLDRIYASGRVFMKDNKPVLSWSVPSDIKELVGSDVTIRIDIKPPQ